MKTYSWILAGALLLSTAGTPLSAEMLSLSTPDSAGGVAAVSHRVAEHPVPDGDGIRNIRRDRFKALGELERDRVAAVLALLLLGQVPRESASLAGQPNGMAGR